MVCEVCEVCGKTMYWCLGHAPFRFETPVTHSSEPSPEVVEPCPTCGIETLEQDHTNGGGEHG